MRNMFYHALALMALTHLPMEKNYGGGGGYIARPKFNYWGDQEKVEKRNKLGLFPGELRILAGLSGRPKKEYLKTLRANIVKGA